MSVRGRVYLLKLNVTRQQIHSPRPAVEAKESGALLTGRGGLKPPSAAEAERSDTVSSFSTLAHSRNVSNVEEIVL